MKLSLINFNPAKNISKKLFSEGYARVYSHDYTGDQVTDPRPSAVSLGRWRSPKGNQLFAGLNLDYLSDEQVGRLQQHLPSILRDRNLKRRVRKLRSLAPDIFNAAYRTYKRDEMHNIEPGVLKFAKPLADTPPEGEPEEPVSKPRASLADKIMARHEKPEEVPRKTAPARPEKPVKPIKPEEEPEEPEDVDEVDEIAPEEEETI